MGAETSTKVILVGGLDAHSRRAGAVRRMTGGKEPNMTVNPTRSSRSAGALQGVLKGEVEDVVMHRVTPLSGRAGRSAASDQVMNGTRRIRRGARRLFSTAETTRPPSTSRLQGERESSDNRQLARFRLEGIQPGPARHAADTR